MQSIKHLIQRSHFTTLLATRLFSSSSSEAPLFDSAFTLSSTIRFHLNLNQPEAALPHFVKWRERSIKPDKFTVPSLIKLTLALQEPQLHGEQIHCLSVKCGQIGDIFVSTSLVEMYFKYGDFKSPLKLFSEISNKDAAFFTVMISGFTQNGLSSQALDFFIKMLHKRIEPNKITLTALFALCSQMKNLMLGKNLHCFSLKRGVLIMMDVILQTAIVDMYVKCANLCYAKRFFDRMSQKNLASWNSMINGFFTNGLFPDALGLFKDMIVEGWKRPRSCTLALALNICGATTNLRKGKEVHAYILKCRSSESEELTECNSLIDMYLKGGDIKTAVLIFERMNNRNVVTWTIMIAGYGSYGWIRKALALFDEMTGSGTEPDGVTFISVLSACGHSGLVHEGTEIFFSMTKDYNIVPEMKHFVCMVDLYGRAGLFNEAVYFIRTMPVEPTKFVWGALLSCCRNHKNLELGEFAAKKSPGVRPIQCWYLCYAFSTLC